jgi:hypothetical protein
MRARRKLTLVSFALVGLFLSVVPEVFAVVGRPLTPVSYAGVARRTVRRGGYGY